MRFLLTRRWILFLLVVAVLAYGCVWLGEWQFRRLHEREARNAHTTANLAATPVDYTALERPRQSDEWKRVRAEGTYLADDTVVVRYRTLDGEPGVQLVTPLRTDDGRIVVVDRGWTATENSGDVPTQLPALPSGRVTVDGWLRLDATGRGIDVEEHSVRAISSVEIAEALGLPGVLPGYLSATAESPAPAEEPVRTEPPDLGSGPHFFYGLQWWFFGALAVFGFCYLAYDERRRLLRAERPTGSDEVGRDPTAPPAR